MIDPCETCAIPDDLIWNCEECFDCSYCEFNYADPCEDKFDYMALCIESELFYKELMSD